MTNSGQLQKSVEDIASAHPEVEFALVLARTIDAVNADPEQLRSAVYELARHKLQQLSDEDPSEKARLMHALEVAIAGVESHSNNHLVGRLLGPTVPMSGPLLAPPTSGPLMIEDTSRPPVSSRRRRRPWHASMVLRFAAIVVFFLFTAGVFMIQRRGVALATFRYAVTHLGRTPPQPQTKTADVAPAAAAPAPQKPTRPLPTAYGVYAESGGRLFELQLLPGRAPDPRVAISAAITKPSETVLPDGRVRFIVFQREAPVGSGGAADVIEVRVIAQVKQATSFDPNGKPQVSGDDGWVIRNISFPYRAAPIKEDPQMYEIQPREPDAVLAPGRYALVEQDYAYDFTVAGTVTDKRQCLQRIAAANGTFYAACDKP